MYFNVNFNVRLRHFLMSSFSSLLLSMSSFSRQVENVDNYRYLPSYTTNYCFQESKTLGVKGKSFIGYHYENLESLQFTLDF